MARGGKREGAGRKAGSITKRTRELTEAALADGISPLDFMLARLRDEGLAPDVRMDAAKAAAPYCHPRLQNIEAHGNLTETYEDRLARVANGG